jgi:[amino group carrier protein]-lysine/ornithine hydrolase
MESSSQDTRRLDLALRTLAAYSPSGEELGVAHLIESELVLRGFNPRVDAAGNVLCEYGAGNTTLLLCGHMDTVPGELPIRNENSELFGRGACDAKGALLSLLYAFEDLAVSKINARMIFAAVTGEEQTSVGLAELINNRIRSDFAIFGEPGGVSRITVGYRGHINLALEVITPEVHASAPKLTRNAAEVMFELYNSIKQELDAVKNESTEMISASLTEIQGGSAHNVIPGRVEATIDVRIPVGFSNELAMNKIKATTEACRQANPEARITTVFKDSTEPYRVKLDSPLVRAMTRSILKTGAKPSMVTKSGTGDMNTYALTFGIDSVTYGPGDAKLSHTSEEHVSFKEILACSEIVVSAAKELIVMKSRVKS